MSLGLTAQGQGPNLGSRKRAVSQIRVLEWSEPFLLDRDLPGGQTFFLTFGTTRPPGNRMFNGFYHVLLAPSDTRNCPTCYDPSDYSLYCLLWLWGRPLLCPGADWPLFPFHPKQLDRWLTGKSSHPETCCTPVTDAFSRGRLLLLVLRTWRLLFKAQENRQEACSCCLPLLFAQRQR